jgi:small subunit ribosomal protein S3
MGQKVHPIGIRLGIVKEHTSVWYADGRTYADYLFADLKVREYLSALGHVLSSSHMC